MANRLIIPPTALPLSVEDVKDHLEEVNSDKDNYIRALILAAADLCGSKTKRSIMPQTRELTLDQYPEDGWIELEYPPVINIESIAYLDSSGNQQVLSPASYVLDNSSDFTNAWLGIAKGRDWPQTYDQINAIRIRYVAGYEDPAAVPSGLAQWMKLIIGHWYANREAVTNGVVSGNYAYVEDLLNHYEIF